MSRLITFGCSFVYGHGLPDCHIPPNLQGPEPSKMGWPNMLADKLGYECVNKAEVGMGNFEILLKLLDTKLEPDDIVIIGFTYFPRFDRYRMTDKEGNGKIIAKDFRSQRDMVVNMLGSDHYPEKNYWDNWLCIQHCELYLSSKNIKYIIYQNVQKLNQEVRPKKFIDLKNFWNEGHLILVDLANDLRHPGIESNRLQFEMIHDKIRKL